MYKEAIRPVWAEINLSNLDYNIKNIKAKLSRLTATVTALSRSLRFSEQTVLTHLPYQRFRRLSF